MASEKIVSPGVFTREIDQSQLPAAVAAIGAAVIGPTVKGPAGIPTVVSSYSEFVAKFGSTFTSGSGAAEQTYKYLTNYTAEQYLKYADSLTVVRILDGTYSHATASILASGSAEASFKLHTLSDGADQNSFGSEGTNGLLENGTANNIRYEISNRNENKGTFTLSIRRGNDTNRRKVVLEQFNNVSMDPNSSNYIAKLIGDQVYTLRDSGGTDPYLQLSGSYPNQSNYVRVEVFKNAYNYLDENGAVRSDSLREIIPLDGTGSFGGASDGTVNHPKAMYENITSTNVQGLTFSGTGNQGYQDAINLLKNQDEYDINMLVLPGLADDNDNHAIEITRALNMCEDRGDCFLLIDPTLHGAAISTAISNADDRDSNYAAMYWPWIKIADPDLNKNVWVPASTVIPGVYAFNDRVAAPWFAPAGLNRGGIDAAVMAERKLTQTNRDDLYDANINPIASFPNSGVVAYGQKTLQKRPSALDRVNVRRLLIAAKKFVASSSKFLVFEQNTAVTRNRFKNIVNPYFENVQQKQGLYSFKILMDETNNTSDVIDRNQLVGQIFLQPTRTAEYIIIDFNVLPTGASFPV